MERLGEQNLISSRTVSPGGQRPWKVEGGVLLYRLARCQRPGGKGLWEPLHDAGWIMASSTMCWRFVGEEVKISLGGEYGMGLASSPQVASCYSAT